MCDTSRSAAPEGRERPTARWLLLPPSATPLHVVSGPEGVDDERDGELGVGAEEDQRPQKVVPMADERKEAERDEGGLRGA